jgi:hypothetical protein
MCGGCRWRKHNPTINWCTTFIIWTSITAAADNRLRMTNGSLITMTVLFTVHCSLASYCSILFCSPLTVHSPCTVLFTIYCSLFTRLVLFYTVLFTRGSSHGPRKAVADSSNGAWSRRRVGANEDTRHWWLDTKKKSRELVDGMRGAR